MYCSSNDIAHPSCRPAESPCTVAAHSRCAHATWRSSSTRLQRRTSRCPAAAARCSSADRWRSGCSRRAAGRPSRSGDPPFFVTEALKLCFSFAFVKHGHLLLCHASLNPFLPTAKFDKPHGALLKPRMALLTSALETRAWILRKASASREGAWQLEKIKSSPLCNQESVLCRLYAPGSSVSSSSLYLRAT